MISNKELKQLSPSFLCKCYEAAILIGEDAVSYYLDKLIETTYEDIDSLPFISLVKEGG